MKKTLILLLITAALLITACANPTPTPAESPSAQPTQSATHTPVVTPTVTPTPVVTPTPPPELTETPQSFVSNMLLVESLKPYNYYYFSINYMIEYQGTYCAKVQDYNAWHDSGELKMMNVVVKDTDGRILYNLHALPIRPDLGKRLVNDFRTNYAKENGIRINEAMSSDSNCYAYLTPEEAAKVSQKYSSQTILFTVFDETHCYSPEDDAWYCFDYVQFKHNLFPYNKQE